jgi:multicomponent Na+:H+ antiporter subunit F
MGPTLADRIIALDVGLMALMCATTVFAVERDAEELLLVPIIISIVGFTASVAVSRAIEHERSAP